MKKKEFSSFKFILIILFILGIIGYVWAQYFSPAATQRKNLLIADQFIAETLAPPLKKIEIDLSVLDANGLRGPADGKVSISYEFCIPNTEKCKAEVSKIDNTVQFSHGSPGRIGATKDQFLCIGSTGKNYKKVLSALAELPYIKRIIECHFE